jgi:hypothetical protein
MKVSLTQIVFNEKQKNKDFERHLQEGGEPLVKA